MESMLALNNFKTIKPLTLMPPHTLTLGPFFGAGDTASLSGHPNSDRVSIELERALVCEDSVAPAVMAVMQTPGQSYCLVGVSEQFEQKVSESHSSKVLPNNRLCQKLPHQHINYTKRQQKQAFESQTHWAFTFVFQFCC